MEKKKGKKFNILLSVIVLVSVALMLITSLYLYYSKVDNNKKGNVVVKNFEMLLMFNGDNQINAHGIKNGWTTSKEFSIENFSKDTIGKYKIVLEVITPLSNMIDENFVYTLEGSSDSKDSSNKVINVSETPIPVITKELGVSEITPLNTHNYKLTLKLDNSIKKYPSDNIFAVKVKITNDN